MKNRWDNEYDNPQFTSFSDEPHKGVKEFLRFVKKETGELEGSSLLDIGCGIGKDARYAAEHYGMRVVGFDISKVAIGEAIQRSKGMDDISFFISSAGEKFPCEDASSDFAICVMTLHTLSSGERTVFLSELSRVMKPGGYVYIKTFVREGDQNAKRLLSEFPGTEESSYIHPDLGIEEHVFSEPALKDFFSGAFDIISYEKEEGYQRWGNQSYKRKYGLVYLRKR